MFLFASGNSAKITFYIHVRFAVESGNLSDFKLTGLSEQLALVLPFLGVIWILRIVLELSWEVEIAVRALFEWNSEGMAEIALNPSGVRVDIIEDSSIMQRRIIDNFHYRIHVSASLVLRVRWIESVEPNGVNADWNLRWTFE
jgi:hypothetical protein